MKKIIKILAFALTFVMLALALTACAPKKDHDKAAQALKDKEYFTTNTLGLTCDYIVTGTKTVKDKDGNVKIEHVTIRYYKDSKTANEDWKNYKEATDDQNKDNQSDWVVKKSGKMIYFGTKAAIKAAS